MENQIQSAQSRITSYNDVNYGTTYHLATKSFFDFSSHPLPLTASPEIIIAIYLSPQRCIRVIWAIYYKVSREEPPYEEMTRISICARVTRHLL